MTRDLGLATVASSDEAACRVQFLGSGTTANARYSAKVREGGVVIRPCHLVLADRSTDPPEIVWRVATIATVERVGDGRVTINDGLRPPVHGDLIDARPEGERRPVAAGDTLIVRANPAEGVVEVLDIAVAGRPAHPERLHAATMPDVRRVYGR